MRRWGEKGSWGKYSGASGERKGCVEEIGGHQDQLQLVKGLMVQIRECEHHLEGLKGPLKAVFWGLTLWEPSPELGWRHAFLVIGSQ